MNENTMPLPCPFCESEEVEYVPTFVDNTDAHFIGSVECLKCQASGPELREEEFLGSDDKPTAPAITAWNSISSRVKELEEILREINSLIDWSWNGIGEDFQDRIAAALNKEPSK